MHTTEEFDRLMERVRQGSSEAINEVVEHFGEHILRVVRRKLAQEMRTQFDSDDFTQDVWASFFAVPHEQLDFRTPGALEAYLAQMARNKVVEAARQRLMLQKNNVNRELSLNDSTINLAEAVDARQPTPSQVVVAEEEMKRLQGTLPTRHRPLLDMLRGGHSYREIAQALGLNEKTIRRVVRKLTQD